MPSKLFNIDATALTAYDPAAPLVVVPFEPVEYLVRPDASNTAEVILSFDGESDAYQVPLPAGGGITPVSLRSRSTKLYAKRAAIGTAKVVVTAKTDT